VLHRDIKPGNIIVGQYGETLVVDWGLAKATGRADPSASERTLMPSSSSGSAETLPGTAIGTPAYMSPEQAAGELDQLGPTSDVYSLGATLYCLLTGRPPFDGKDAAVVLKSVQDGAFPWPRQIEPSIDNALQAVCLKAMARKPGDRYATPKSLADDIEHWLADQPVTAWREPLSRRLRRWARQHRSLVTAAAAAGIVALAGLGAVAAVQADANSRLRYTNIELTVANAKVTKGNADLLQANERERQRFELATEAIRRYHTGVSEDILLKQEQFKELRTRLLRDALEFYHKLERLLSDGSDTRSRRALGRAYEEVGELTDKIGATEDAIAAHRKALDVRKSLVTEASSELVSRIEAGRTLNAIGTLHAKISQFDEALRSFAEARSLLEDPVAAGSDRPAALSELARSHYGTGSTYYQAGKMREALASYESSRSLQLRLAANKLDTLEDQRLLSWCENDIGLIRSEEGRISEALAALERSQRIKQEIVRAHPEVAEYQRDLAISHNNIGVVLREQGNPEDALVAHEAARRLRQNVASAYPTVTSSQRELANSLIEIGEILFTVRRTDQARMRIGAAIAILEDLQTTDSDVLSTHVRMLQALKGLGAVEVVEGHAAAAQALLKKGIAIGEQLGSNQGEALYYLACCHALLGGVIRSQGPADPSAEGARQLDQAMDTLRRAVAAGHRPLEWLKRDADLDPLRRRSDFQALLLDLAFPTESFVE
jgi:serine/threonine-protein kinase